MDIKRELKELLKHYATAQHNREITPEIVTCENGYTAGANNVYFTYQGINFGTTSKDGGNTRAQGLFELPSDYIAGEDLTFVFYWQSSVATDVIEYDINFYYSRDSSSITSANNPTGEYTGEGANEFNRETLTVTGTNLQENDSIIITIKIEDKNNAVTILCRGMKLIVPVNIRT